MCMRSCEIKTSQKSKHSKIILRPQSDLPPTALNGGVSGVCGSAVSGNFLCGFSVLAKILCGFSVFPKFFCGFSVPELPTVRGFWPIFVRFFGLWRKNCGFSVFKYVLCGYRQVLVCFGVAKSNQYFTFHRFSLRSSLKCHLYRSFSIF